MKVHVQMTSADTAFDCQCAFNDADCIAATYCERYKLPYSIQHVVRPGQSISSEFMADAPETDLNHLYLLEGLCERCYLRKTR